MEGRDCGGRGTYIAYPRRSFDLIRHIQGTHAQGVPGLPRLLARVLLAHQSTLAAAAGRKFAHFYKVGLRGLRAAAGAGGVSHGD